METTSKNKSWKEKYVEILLFAEEGNVSVPEDDPVMLTLSRELIDSKHLEGIYNLDGEMNTTMVWIKFLTTSGRLFLDELSEELRKKTLTYRAKVALLSVSSWLVGLFTAFITSVFQCT